MFKMIVCSDPVIWTLVIALVSGLVGALIGAWYQSKPISEAEMRGEVTTRQYREIDDEDIGI